MIRFDDILEKVTPRLGEKDVAGLQKAYVFAARAHKGQVRRSGEPYLSHPLEVTGMLADMSLDRTTLVAVSAAPRKKPSAATSRTGPVSRPLRPRPRVTLAWPPPRTQILRRQMKQVSRWRAQRPRRPTDGGHHRTGRQGAA